MIYKEKEIEECYLSKRISECKDRYNQQDMELLDTEEGLNTGPSKDEAGSLHI